MWPSGGRGGRGGEGGTGCGGWVQTEPAEAAHGNWVAAYRFALDLSCRDPVELVPAPPTAAAAAAPPPLHRGHSDPARAAHVMQLGPARRRRLRVIMIPVGRERGARLFSRAAAACGRGGGRSDPLPSVCGARGGGEG